MTAFDREDAASDDFGDERGFEDSEADHAGPELLDADDRREHEIEEIHLHQKRCVAHGFQTDGRDSVA
ncbi:MAG: hypothetical protein R3C97_11540 [Geminicoccaceae bacterium]